MVGRAIRLSQHYGSTGRMRNVLYTRMLACMVLLTSLSKIVVSYKRSTKLFGGRFAKQRHKSKSSLSLEG
jgi:hypothetical protein